LKAPLTQTAWAGANKKNSAFQFRYQRLKTRRGVKRATIAVTHAQIIAVYWGCFETVSLINNNVRISNGNNANL